MAKNLVNIIGGCALFIALVLVIILIVGGTFYLATMNPL